MSVHTRRQQSQPQVHSEPQQQQQLSVNYGGSSRKAVCNSLQTHFVTDIKHTNIYCIVQFLHLLTTV